MKPSELIREYTPFRLWVLSMKEYKKLCKRQKYFISSAETKRDYFWNKSAPVWICILFVGRGIPFQSRNDRSGDYDITIYGRQEFDSGWTYWFVESKNRPTIDDAIDSLFSFIEDYDSENFIDHLNKMRNEFEIDLNKIDFAQEEERLRYSSKLEGAINELICSGRWRSVSGNGWKNGWTMNTNNYENMMKNYRELVEY